jgi:hypothetical protein
MRNRAERKKSERKIGRKEFSKSRRKFSQQFVSSIKRVHNQFSLGLKSEGDRLKAFTWDINKNSLLIATEIENASVGIKIV